MPSILIDEVGAYQTLGLYLSPRLPEGRDYERVWRDATSVRWDEKTRSLYSVQITGQDILGYYEQIVAAVQREYGDRLDLSAETRFLSLPVAMIAQLKSHTVKNTLNSSDPC